MIWHLFLSPGHSRVATDARTAALSASTLVQNSWVVKKLLGPNRCQIYLSHDWTVRWRWENWAEQFTSVYVPCEKQYIQQCECDSKEKLSIERHLYSNNTSPSTSVTTNFSVSFDWEMFQLRLSTHEQGIFKNWAITFSVPKKIKSPHQTIHIELQNTTRRTQAPQWQLTA